jgi:excisionase family DNA binding protein
MSEISRTTPLVDLPELLRVDEVAVWADTSRGTIYSAIAERQLPSIRLGRLVRVPRQGLADWIETWRERADG